MSFVKNFILFFGLLIFTSTGHAIKTFVYCSEGSPSSFNPQIATDGTTFNAASKPIYNRLVEFEHGTTKLAPGLAKSWKMTRGGRVFTFNLRKGVKFHTTLYFKPTRDFNADDVIFSFQRMLDPKHPFHKVSGGTYEYFRSMSMNKIIKSVKKLNDYQVQFVLTKPEAPFLASLAMDFAIIQSAEYGAKLVQQGKQSEMDWKPVGTGPFVFKRYKKDTLIRYRAHPDYFRGRAALDRLVFAITPDPSVRTQKLKVGECDLISQPSHTDLSFLRKSEDIRLLEKEGLNVGYIAMNVRKPPFDNVNVRRAVNHALNKKSYLKAIFHDNATVAKNPLPPGMWSYNKRIVDYNYSPEKAKALLKRAGYKDGFSVELWVLPISRPYNPNGKKMGELIQADLAKVGIRVNLVQYDWPTYLAKARQGQHEMAQFGWSADNADPDNFLGILLSCDAIAAGSNRARWCDKKYQDLIAAARTSFDFKTRAALYRKAQWRFKNQAPWVTLAHARVFRAMRSNVVGFKVDPFGADIFYGVDKK